MRKYFRRGYTKRLLKEAYAATAAGDWPLARQYWRAIVRLDPKLTLRERGVFVNGSWAALPTQKQPVWRTLRGSGAYKALNWRAGLFADLLRGDQAKRHRARASLRGLSRRREWRARVGEVHRKHPGKQVIAVAMVEHLGDIVATEPIVRHVRATHPHAHVIAVVRDSYRELLDGNPHVDEVLTVGCLTEWIHLSGGRVFDRTIDLHVPGKFCPVCNVHLVNPTADERIGMHNYYEHGNLLAIACKCAALPVLEDGPRVYVPPATATAVDALRLPERFVAVHCTSNQDVRDWDAAKWPRFAEELIRRHDAHVVEVGLAPVIRSDDPRYVNLCGRLSISETAEVIRRASLFVGIDSGPAHLANAVETPGVILLGHYRAYTRYMPYSGGYANGSNATILYADGPAATLPVERVIEAADARLAARAAPPSTSPTHAEACGGRP